MKLRRQLTLPTVAITLGLGLALTDRPEVDSLSFAHQA
jgi:hypothetical protein